WQPAMGVKKQKTPDGEQDVPAMREWAITEIGRGPMIDAEDIQKHLDAGTLAEEIALMAAVHKFPWPLEIVTNPEHEAERARLVAERDELDATRGRDGYGVSEAPADIWADRRRAIKNRLDEFGPAPRGEA